MTTTSPTGQGRQRPVGRIRQRRARRKQAQRQWQEAGTLADLGELTAQWLEGTVVARPGYCGRPDPETRPLVSVLAELNRAGYVTEGSQPGEGPVVGYDGQEWWQRAGVSGFADPDTAERLSLAAERARLWVVVHHPERRVLGRFRGSRWRKPVTIADGDTVTAFGTKLDRDTVRFLYEDVGDEAMAELLDAWQVTVIDTQWGRNDALWPVLSQAVRR